MTWKFKPSSSSSGVNQSLYRNIIDHKNWEEQPRWLYGEECLYGIGWSYEER
mgnify:CR=1 FL=1